MNLFRSQIDTTSNLERRQSYKSITKISGLQKLVTSLG